MVGGMARDAGNSMFQTVPSESTAMDLLEFMLVNNRKSTLIKITSLRKFTLVKRLNCSHVIVLNHTLDA